MISPSRSAITMNFFFNHVRYQKKIFFHCTHTNSLFPHSTLVCRLTPTSFDISLYSVMWKKTMTWKIASFSYLFQKWFHNTWYTLAFLCHIYSRTKTRTIRSHEIWKAHDCLITIWIIHIFSSCLRWGPLLYLPAYMYSRQCTCDTLTSLRADWIHVDAILEW